MSFLLCVKLDKENMMPKRPMKGEPYYFGVEVLELTFSIMITAFFWYIVALIAGY